ncbi:MAG: NADH-quinone oxidoreductase subunit C [Cytophagales bacterium]|nr:NADH-quinone oxidoreductase subunit C [Cytophagales bacterium]
MKKYIQISNAEPVDIHDVPVLRYEDFCDTVIVLLKDTQAHIISYHAYKHQGVLRFIIIIAHDKTCLLYVTAHELYLQFFKAIHSLVPDIPSIAMYEREICENYGIDFIDHPWLKPVRYPHNRKNKLHEIFNYPFFTISGDEVHEVGVGPIHAGVIEPGHFRFVCVGENVKHLEIQLGYQHRGVESLFIDKLHPLQRMILAESVAGDAVVAHALAHIMAVESIIGYIPTNRIQISRTIASELERIAVHVGDLSGICTDIAYQLGSAVFGALRTPIINYIQSWCGNRFAKGLLRVGYEPYPLTTALLSNLKNVLQVFEKKYVEISDKTFSQPNVLNRLQKTGIVTTEQGLLTGATGMIARTMDINRDIRLTHSYQYYLTSKPDKAILEDGDTYARSKIRDLEIRNSIKYIYTLISALEASTDNFDKYRDNIFGYTLPANKLVVSLTESWRGETMHAIITGTTGEILQYKIKDASFNNWIALAIALRNNEISDFPVCNKSFDLSYCGHDL